MTEGDSETMGYQWALSEATLPITGGWMGLSRYPSILHLTVGRFN